MKKKKETKWTRFMDMHSGGGQKEKWAHIFIEAPEQEAKIIFYNRFRHNPSRVTCTCCGEDYSISEESSLEQATAYERGCAYAYLDSKGNEVPQSEAWKAGKGMKKGYSSAYVERQDRAYRSYISLNDYLQSGKALAIYAKDIKDDERVGDVPEEGYVWV